MSAMWRRREEAVSEIPGQTDDRSLCQGRGKGMQREEVSLGGVKEEELAKKMVIFSPQPFQQRPFRAYFMVDARVRVLCLCVVHTPKLSSGVCFVQSAHAACQLSWLAEPE